MLAISAAAILYVSRGTPGPTPPPTAVAETLKNVHDAIQLLDREDSARAHDLMTRALHAREGQSNPTLLALDTLAKIWEGRRQHHLRVERRRRRDRQARPGLGTPGHGPGLPRLAPECARAARRRRPTRRAGPRPTRRSGEGQNALRNGQVKEGFDALEEALALYRGMPPTSVFADNARKRAEYKARSS